MLSDFNSSGLTSVRRKFRLGRRIFVTTCAAAIISFPAYGQGTESASDTKPISKTEQLRQQIVEKGLAFLAKEGQSEQGTFSDRVGPGVTALAITSALRNGQAVDHPMVAEGLKALESYVKPDGGVYGNGRLKNYESCVAMVCFAEANKTGKYNQILKRANAFVTGIQYGEGTKDPSDPWYGGVGYGGAGRPDLSNTGYMIEALRAMETPASDPAIQRALVFISRCQNLDSPYNDTRFADKVDDGGFYYYYYHTFAAALDAVGLKTVVDSDGTEHDWKADLVAELAERQNQDGSWNNENQRWFENDKNLATSFALMALGHCQ